MNKEAKVMAVLMITTVLGALAGLTVGNVLDLFFPATQLFATFWATMGMIAGVMGGFLAGLAQIAKQ